MRVHITLGPRFHPCALLVGASTIVSATAYAAEPSPASTTSTTTATTAREVREEPKAEPIHPKSTLLWLDAQGGIETANLSTFSADFRQFAVGFLPRSGVGPMVDAGVGLRLVFVTLGVRGRVARFVDDEPSHAVRDWTMSSLDGELGFRAPLGRFEPFVTLASGYTTFGGFRDAVSGIQSGFNVNGFNARLGVGADYFLGRHISVGGSFTGEVLALTRPGVPVREVAKLPGSQTLDAAAVRFLEANGSTYGTALALGANVKAHF